ncbi:MAG TPA: manganese efflux pump [Candidatus Hydrogenedentes bacterium]|nr:manganese efflux pump [Candidatus Hydrogenedentota bacterium]HIJ73827.1 manganese efflux pump [Candidatus Hydrogenedentota bacterium]
MSLITVVFVAFGLAMDAFAVSVASGFAIKRLRAKHALRIALFFGLFQAFMPVIGWSAGLGLRGLITALDHWIAFGLLAGIGGRMIYEAAVIKSVERKVDLESIYVLLVLSVATSIDALVVGLSLSFLSVAIVTPAIVIGAITFCCSFAGVYVGDHFGHFFEKKIEILGGVVLIGIGLKILIQHLA